MLQDRRASMRLGASSCISHLYNNAVLPNEYDPLISQQLLPVVIRLFDDLTTISSQLGMNITSVQERAISLLAYLVEQHADLQIHAMEGDAITKLSKTVLEGLSTETLVGGDVVNNPDKLKESVLLAVASLTSQTEECRKNVIDLKLLPFIVSSLESSNIQIKIAACKCCRSLSRSVKNLRTSLMDAGIQQPLFDLLFDRNLNVQITACATLCNIVLDFSPMKKAVIERGGVEQLVKLIQTENEELRLNAVWALKNMLFHTDLETKKNVVTCLGWPKLMEIINDPSEEIQAQALNVFRNL
jgi:armadillo repeat-containing protein 8